MRSQERPPRAARRITSVPGRQWLIVACVIALAGLGTACASRGGPAPVVAPSQSPTAVPQPDPAGAVLAGPPEPAAPIAPPEETADDATDPDSAGAAIDVVGDLPVDEGAPPSEDTMAQATKSHCFPGTLAILRAARGARSWLLIGHAPFPARPNSNLRAQSTLRYP